MNAEEFFKEQAFNSERKHCTKDDCIKFAELYHEAKKAESLNEVGKTMTAEKVLSEIEFKNRNVIMNSRNFRDMQIEAMEEYASQFRQDVSDGDACEPIENALYSTRKFFTEECTELAQGILMYLKESGFVLMRDRMKGGNQ